MWPSGYPPSEAQRREAKSALVLLTAHNIVQNSSLTDDGSVAGNLAATAMLVNLGRDAALDWDEMVFAFGNRVRPWGCLRDPAWSATHCHAEGGSRRLAAPRPDPVGERRRFGV